MTRPLPARRRRQLAAGGRLAGLLMLVLAAGLAATTAPATPPTAGGSAVASDSTVAAIERVDVTGGQDGTPPAIDVYLKSGYGRATAEAVAESIDETSARADGERFRVTVRYDGGSVERWVRTTAAATRGLGAVTPISAEGTASSASLVPRDTTDEVYDQPDEWPELIGGLDGLAERLVYPPAAREAGAEGRAVLQFVVGTDGGVDDLKVLRSTGNPALDAAAREAVQASRFRPGTVDGESVRVRFAVPVTFRLPGEGGAGTDHAGADGVYDSADVQPELVGGLESLQERLVYPEAARAAGVEGRVIIQFVVSPEGRVVDPVVARSPDPRLSEAALAAVRQMEFRPGRQQGEAVPVRFALPVTFRLPADEAP
jgi:TonB family protein